MIKIYQIYFDENTKKYLEPEFTPYFNERKDGYFENSVIKDIYEKINSASDENISDEDYIGISSWKQRGKTDLKGHEIISHIQKDIENGIAKDVYLYSPIATIKYTFDNIPSGYDMNGVIKGPDIWTRHKAWGEQVYNADILLNNSNILPFNILDGKWVFLDCNYWIAKKKIFNEYYEKVLKPTIDFFDREDIKQLIPSWYKHSHEQKKYNSCSFVMEGLFGSFLAHNEYSYSYIVKKGIKRKYKKINIIGYDNGSAYIPVIKNSALVPKYIHTVKDKKYDIKPCNIINLQPPYITDSNKDIYVFFHICCINNYIDITNEVLDEIISCGLYEKCEKIYYSILGELDPILQERILTLNKLQLIHFSSDIQEVEYPSLINLYKFCQNHDAYVLYIHTKGVSLPKDNFRQNWRKRLIEKVIKEYKVCVSFLNEGCDISGCGWKQLSNDRVDYNQGEYEHFSGNYFWANSEYIQTLPKLDEIRDSFYKYKTTDFLKFRLQCEFWVGMSKNIKVGINGELNKEYSNTNFYKTENI